MRRLALIAAVLTGCSAGVEPGGVYVLPDGVLIDDGPGSGAGGRLAPGSVVRVLALEPDQYGINYAKIYIERVPPDPLGLRDGHTGTTAYVLASLLDDAPAAD